MKHRRDIRVTDMPTRRARRPRPQEGDAAGGRTEDEHRFQTRPDRTAEPGNAKRDTLEHEEVRI